MLVELHNFTSQKSHVSANFFLCKDFFMCCYDFLKSEMKKKENITVYIFLDLVFFLSWFESFGIFSILSKLNENNNLGSWHSICGFNADFRNELILFIPRLLLWCNFLSTKQRNYQLKIYWLWRMKSYSCFKR